MGCVRAFIQVISYEIIMSTVFLCLLLITGSSNFEIYMDQQTNFSIFMYVPALGIICFIATLMETNRPPFDLSEAESDVVAGYTVEYAGVLFGLFYLGEYVNIFTNAIVMTILFIGGGCIVFNQLFVLVNSLDNILHIIHNELNLSFDILALGFCSIKETLSITLLSY